MPLKEVLFARAGIPIQWKGGNGREVGVREEARNGHVGDGEGMGRA